VADFSGDSDTWNGPGRTDSLIQLYAAERGCRKEGRIQDAKGLRETYEVLLDKVISSASWLDMRNPARIRDVMGRDVLPARDPFDYNV
jgi:hypothetical protein